MTGSQAPDDDQGALYLGTPFESLVALSHRVSSTGQGLPAECASTPVSSTGQGLPAASPIPARMTIVCGSQALSYSHPPLSVFTTTRPNVCHKHTAGQIIQLVATRARTEVRQTRRFYGRLQKKAPPSCRRPQSVSILAPCEHSSQTTSKRLKLSATLASSISHQSVEYHRISR